jgi:hypothetical protein
MAKFDYEPVREREAHISDPLKIRWQNGVNTKVCAFCAKTPGGHPLSVIYNAFTCM